MEENKTNFENNTIELFLFLFKWKKQLIFVGLSAFIISLVISFIIKPQYKATSSLFSLRSFNTSTYIIKENNPEDFLMFGDEDDLEKLLQIAKSEDLQKLVVEKFNLFRHWDIKESDPYKNTWMRLKFEEMVSIKRTEMMSLKVDVYDYDKDTAALMANAIPDLIDTLKNRIAKQVTERALIFSKNIYLNSCSELKSVEDSLQHLRNLGVLDYNLEVEAYSKSNGKALANGKGNAAIEEKLKKLQQFGGGNLALTDYYLKLKERNFHLKKMYEEAMFNYNNPLPASFRVQYASVPEKKSKPVRWLLVSISTLSSLLIAILFILILHKINQLKRESTAV